MTRVEVVISQLTEMSDTERQEIRQFLSQFVEDRDLNLSAEDWAEIDRRSDELDAGTSEIEDKETVLRKLRESLGISRS